MNIVNGDKIGKTTGMENGKPGFIFYGIHLGYSKEKNYIFKYIIADEAQYLKNSNTQNDKSSESYMEGNYWSSELWLNDSNNGKSLDMLGGSGYFADGGWAKIGINSKNYARPIIDDSKY